MVTSPDAVNDDLLPEIPDDLDALAADIRAGYAAAYQERDAALGHARRALEHAIRTGHRLRAAKDKVQPGSWLTWLEEKTGIPRTTATDWMRLAAHERRVVHAGSEREALRLLASPRAPKAEPPPTEPESTTAPASTDTVPVLEGEMVKGATEQAPAAEAKAVAAPQLATPEAPPQSSPPLAATVTPAVPAEAAQQQPPALAWPSEVSFDQDGQVILPKVRRKHQLDAGAKIEQALVELGLLSGQRLKYTFVSDIVLGCVHAHEGTGVEVPVALAKGLADVGAAMAASDLGPEEAEALSVAVTLVRYRVEKHAVRPGKEDMRAALRDLEKRHAFTGPPGGSVTLAPLVEDTPEAAVAETPPAAEPVAQESPVLVASPVEDAAPPVDAQPAAATVQAASPSPGVVTLLGQAVAAAATAQEAQPPTALSLPQLQAQVDRVRDEMRVLWERLMQLDYSAKPYRQELHKRLGTPGPTEDGLVKGWATWWVRGVQGLPPAVQTQVRRELGWEPSSAPPSAPPGAAATQPAAAQIPALPAPLGDLDGQTDAQLKQSLEACWKDLDTLRAAYVQRGADRQRLHDALAARGATPAARQIALAREVVRTVVADLKGFPPNWRREIGWQFNRMLLDDLPAEPAPTATTKGAGRVLPPKEFPKGAGRVLPPKEFPVEDDEGS